MTDNGETSEHVSGQVETETNDICEEIILHLPKDTDQDITKKAIREPVAGGGIAGEMMEETSVFTDESYDSYDDQEDRPRERWAPLGAAASASPPSGAEASDHMTEIERLRHMEDEQEMLNSSLLSLTTHFAQVQFRLKQIVSAPDEEKEILLKELEEFAFKGIPDVRGSSIQDAQILDEMSEKEHDMKIREQRQKQVELIEQLRTQLEDLESYAYQTGEGDLPTSQVVEKQKVVIDQLKNKLELDIDNFDKLSPEQLRQIVDQAVGQIVNPAKVKEKLVDQLKTQIVDLERFIDFLQGEAQTPGPLGAKCTCPKHSKVDQPCDYESDGSGKGDPTCCVSPHHRPRLHSAKSMDESAKHTMREQTMGILRQTLTVLQIFAVSQFGCGGKEFQRNVLKRTNKANHWGDMRAHLEVTLERVMELQRRQEHLEQEDAEYSDSEESPVVQHNQELTAAVRKELAMALKDLLQHGLMEVGQSTSLVPFGCFPTRSANQSTRMMHAWDLFVKYYEMKHGKEYNESPARKLSQSFSLDIVGGKAITIKQTLLSAIEEVLSTHRPLKRSDDSQFKAFLCIALNQKKMVSWLRLILRNSALIEYYYQPWSYVVKTGFDDALVSLDRLSRLNFRLTVDLAVRPFTNIKDAF